MSLGAILPAVGTIIGALGGSGNQASTNQTSNQSYTGTQNTNQSYTGQGTSTTTGQTDQTNTQASTQATSGTQSQVEDAGMSQLRSGLSKLFAQQLNQAQQPVYGDAEKTKFLEDLNTITAGSNQALQRQLASSGMSSSGAQAAGGGDIQKNWREQATAFFRDLPAKEAEAKQTKVNNLLGLATGWLGSSPLSTVSTGQSTGSTTGQASTTTNEATNQTQSGTQTGTTTSSGNQTGSTTGSQSGPSVWSGILSGLGGLLGSGWSFNGEDSGTSVAKLPTSLSKYWTWQPGVNS